MLRWNYYKNEYEDYTPPKGNVSLYSNDMEQLINCACCGKQIKYGDAYTSHEIHNEIGFGYMVCSGCHQVERVRYLKYR